LSIPAIHRIAGIFFLDILVGISHNSGVGRGILFLHSRSKKKLLYCRVFISMRDLSISVVEFKIARG